MSHDSLGGFYAPEVVHRMYVYLYSAQCTLFEREEKGIVTLPIQKIDCKTWGNQ